MSSWIAGWQPAPGSGKHAHLNGGLGLSDTDSPGAYELGWNADDDNAILAVGDLMGGTWTPAVGANENLPITWVNWFEAYAFCIWDGGFLPSEAEWEYAAAGGSEQRQYPWGSTPPGASNDYAIYDCYYGGGSGPGTCAGSGVANIATVGTAALGAGLWGNFDLAGSVAEWTLDWYAPALATPCVDCASLTGDGARVFRGGDFRDDSSFFDARGHDERDANPMLGFRCARTP